MPHNVKAVANAIIQKAAANGEKISPLKLQKLLYYVCGYYVASSGKPLIDHTFEAWDYGPVVPMLYREFRHYGNGPITGLACDPDWDSGAKIPVAPPDGDKRFDKVLDFVWGSYGKFSAVQLSRMTHAANSPWAKTREENPGIRDADIDRDKLIEHFSKFVKKKSKS
ncbi:Panacea domain-containing protein [Loktanella salsilacus]|uniref:Panacea domain-containing protein n=1 Tax=Loktanella salsilacus TaxID=195913 RepID=UPI00373541F5